MTLNTTLQPINAPVGDNSGVAGYDLASIIDRGAIDTLHIKNASIQSAQISNISADKITTGTLTTSLQLGTTTGSVTLDGANARLVAGDGTSNRISINGQDASFRISDPGEDVLTTPENSLALYFNPSSGDLTIRGDYINTNSEVFSDISLEHWFTPVDAYEKETGTSFKIDGDNFTNQLVYFEANMHVEQSGRTAYARIYNETDGAELASSEISSAFVGTYDAGRSIYTTWELVRSAALTFPSGVKEYSLQVKQNQVGGDGDQAHFYVMRLVLVQQ